MKTLGQELVIGLLAASLVICGVGTVLAKGSVPHLPPHPIIPHPIPHNPQYHHYHPIVVNHWPRPVVVSGAVGIAYPLPVMDASDATSAPAPSIRLVNPVENHRTLRYTVNGGFVRLLGPGRDANFDQEVVIRFDRGRGAGQARYVLQDGTYRFVPADGLWSLVRDGDDLAGDGQIGDIAANPLPGM
ncbi:MAG: hypothetical protein ABSG68_05035 [Thermoguttaceae bacterium]|jgi:hypothetical protein